MLCLSTFSAATNIRSEEKGVQFLEARHTRGIPPPTPTLSAGQKFRVNTGFSLVLLQSSSTVYPGQSSTDYQPYYETKPNYSTTLTFSCSDLFAGLTCEYSPALAIMGPNESRQGSLLVQA